MRIYIHIYAYAYIWRVQEESCSDVKVLPCNKVVGAGLVSKATSREDAILLGSV